MKQMKLKMAVVAAATALSASCFAAAPAYEFFDLGSLGGRYSEATGINNDGFIVGMSLDTSGANRAMVWKDLQATDLGTLGGQNGFARAINTSGQIVGSSQDTNGRTRATLWSNGAVTDLGTLGGATSEARGINDAGVVVGSATMASPPFNAPSQAVMWTAGAISSLPTAGGRQGSAAAINDLGNIAGAVIPINAPYPHAVTWTNGVLEDHSTPAQFNAAAFGINNAGVMVGIAEDLPFGGYYAALWDGHSAMALPTLAAGRPSYAHSINESGQIVGYTDDLFGFRATLWQDGAVFDLNEFLDADSKQAGWTLRTAADINDGGSIVGTAFNDQTFEVHAFLITPVPEPTTGVLMVLGLIAIASCNPRGTSRNRR